jgi:tellurite resistance protein TerC
VTVEESGMTVEWWAWVAVIGFILAMLAVDLLFFHREAHEVSIREAAMAD